MKRRFLLPLFLTATAAAQTAPEPRTPARTARPAPPASDKPATPPDPALVAQQAGGSMLRATMSTPADPANATLATVSFFAVPEPPPRTIKKHDLVTIIVNEESDFTSQGTTDLQRTADLDAKIDAFVRFSLQNFALNSAAGNSPEVKLEGTRDFDGTGTVERSDVFNTRITAEVLDVKPNGTMVLQARQHIKNDEEEQMMILSGVCRVEDVTPDNTVLSTQIFDKDLSKTNKGALRDTTRRGWLPKLLDAASPF